MICAQPLSYRLSLIVTALVDLPGPTLGALIPDINTVAVETEDRLTRSAHSPAGESLDEHFVGDRNVQDHQLAQLQLRHDLPKRFCLGDSSRKAVQEYPLVPDVLPCQPLTNHSDDQLIGHQVAGVHVGFRLLAKVRAVGHGVPQDVPGGQMDDVIFLDQAGRLCALPGPRRAEQYHVSLSYRRPLPTATTGTPCSAASTDAPRSAAWYPAPHRPR